MNKMLLSLLLMATAGELLAQVTPYEDKKALTEARNAFEWERTHDLETGDIPFYKRYEAIEKRKTQAEESAFVAKTDAIGQLRWIEMGPTNVGGRIRSLLLQSGNKAIAGGVSGGVWQGYNISDPNLHTWYPINDYFNNLCVSTIAVHPTNASVMYFGTGEGYNNGQAQTPTPAPWTTLYGAGIWKSTNGGKTWARLAATHQAGANIHMAQEQFRFINKIVVADNGHVFVSSIGTTANPGGIFYSTDGGLTFIRILGAGIGSNNNNGADIEKGADGKIYATIGLSADVDKLQVYRFIFAAGAWNTTLLTTGLPTLLQQGVANRRMELACSPNTASTLYAIFVAASTGNGATDIYNVYKSTDFGITWALCAQQPPAGFANINMWYNLGIAVHPTDPNKVVVSADQMATTTNGGNTWNNFAIINPHSDIHTLVFNAAGNLYVGSDGGIHYYANIFGAGVSQNRNNDFGVTQFYSCAVSGNPYSTTCIGGTQDNGTQEFLDDSHAASIQLLGGDGMACHINPNSTNDRLLSSQQGSYSYYLNGVVSAFTNSNVNLWFGNPTIMDWANDVLATSYTPNNIAFYPNVSTAANVVINPFVQPVAISSAGNPNKRISCIIKSPNLLNTLYIGTDGGRVYKIVYNPATNYSITTLTYYNTGLLPVGFISSIDIRGANDNEMIVTFSNYGSNVKNVWYTANAGGAAVWVSLDNLANLPDMPIWSAIFCPAGNLGGLNVLIGTELGCYYTTDPLNGNVFAWQIDNNGPTVRVEQLVYRSSDKMVFMATYGRGMWRSDVFCDTQAWFESDEVNSGVDCSITFRDFSVNVNAALPNREWKYENDPIVQNQLTLTKPCGTRKYHWVRLKIKTPNGNWNSVSRRVGEVLNFDETVFCIPCPPPVPKMEDVSTETYHIFPNPNDKGYFEVKIPENINESAVIKVQIWDSNGRNLYTQEITKNQNRVNIPKGIAQGMYFVAIHTSTENITRKLIVK